MGVSALKLSRLQTDWEPVTWLCFAAAWLCFTTAFRAAKNRCPEKRQKREGENAGALSRQAEKILRCLVAVTGVSLVAFLLEALVLGYVPLFTVDTPHAYSYFHISGVHYFTVSCVLAPPLFVLYLDMLVRHCRRSCPGTAEEKELAVLLKSGGMGALHLQQCLHPAPLTLREEIIPGEILGQLSPLKQEKVRRELAGEKLSHTALTEQGEGFLLLREIQESRAGFNASTLRVAA